MDLFCLKGKKAIVTGGAKGLGWGMAEGLMEYGAQVCIVDIASNTQEAAEEFEKRGYVCHGVVADLSQESDLCHGFNEALAFLGGHLDILINSAGIQRRHLSEDFPLDDWHEVMNINLHAVFILSQMAGRQFIMQESKGKIINVASLLSFFGGYTVPAYAASKGGVAQLTKALSNEWSSKGINVNAIAPGYMATELNTALLADESRTKQILARVPAKRWGTPEDVKGTAIFLASSASDFLCGTVIPVDGGYMGC